MLCGNGMSDSLPKRTHGLDPPFPNPELTKDRGDGSLATVAPLAGQETRAAAGAALGSHIVPQALHEGSRNV